MKVIFRCSPGLIIVFKMKDLSLAMSNTKARKKVKLGDDDDEMPSEPRAVFQLASSSRCVWERERRRERDPDR